MQLLLANEDYFTVLSNINLFFADIQDEFSDLRLSVIYVISFLAELKEEILQSRISWSSCALKLLRQAHACESEFWSLVLALFYFI